jgi:hypothetical protein
MNLNDFIFLKRQETFVEVGPVITQSDTCFLSPKLVILKHFHFSLKKLITKKCNFAQFKLLYVFRKGYKTLKIQIFIEQSSQANSSMFFTCHIWNMREVLV